MSTGFQVTFDCANPDNLASFWAAALGYKLQDPPAGHDTWEDFLRASNVPEAEWNNASAIVDPDGKGPRIYLQRVPEPKSCKNRLHLDLNVSGGSKVPLEERKERVQAEAGRLVSLGARQIRVLGEDSSNFDEFCIVMQDPEGNEFCVQ